jgi:hypothetical protein
MGRTTPERTAIIYNGKTYSYRSFARHIAVARGYFVRRGYLGPGYAVLPVSNIMDFWILSLALRSLGLTTVSVRSPAMLRKLALTDVRCVITTPRASWEGLDGLCTELGLNLLSMSLAGETALPLERPEALHPLGGHILLTSGTTGIHKMVLMSPETDADILRLHVELFGIDQHTLLSVFNLGPWTGGGYKWAASLGLWAAPLSSSKAANHTRRCCAQELPTRCFSLHSSPPFWPRPSARSRATIRCGSL